MNANMYREEFFEDSDFDELIKQDVYCSECNCKLSEFEIKMHRFVGIADPTQMLCQADWLKDAYQQK